MKRGDFVRFKNPKADESPDAVYLLTEHNADRSLIELQTRHLVIVPTDRRPNDELEKVDAVMLLLDKDGHPRGDWKPYDGRTLADHDAVFLPHYWERRAIGIVRHWTTADGHEGFLILRKSS